MVGSFLFLNITLTMVEKSCVTVDTAVEVITVVGLVVVGFILKRRLIFSMRGFWVVVIIEDNSTRSSSRLSRSFCWQLVALASTALPLTSANGEAVIALLLISVIGLPVTMLSSTSIDGLPSVTRLGFSLSLGISSSIKVSLSVNLSSTFGFTSKVGFGLSSALGLTVNLGLDSTLGLGSTLIGLASTLVSLGLATNLGLASELGLAWTLGLGSILMSLDLEVNLGLASLLGLASTLLLLLASAPPLDLILDASPKLALPLNVISPLETALVLCRSDCAKTITSDETTIKMAVSFIMVDE